VLRDGGGRPLREFGTEAKVLALEIGELERKLEGYWEETIKCDACVTVLGRMYF
jgi:hypothetical protein